MSKLTDKTMDKLRLDHSLVKKYKKEFKFGIGNCAAMFVFVIAEFDYEFVYFLERLLPKFDLEVSDVYITPFYKIKTKNADMMYVILDKELEIINPATVIIAEDINFDLDQRGYLFFPEIMEIIKFEQTFRSEKDSAKQKQMKKELAKKQKELLVSLEQVFSEEVD